MSSAYGKIARPQPRSTAAVTLPIVDRLKDGAAVRIERVDAVSAHAALIPELRQLLNYEIEQGNTYPQEEPLDPTTFEAYFLSYDAFVALDEAGSLLGTFYVKPNFPGRCSHICNGGFLTHMDHRGRGVGKVMGRAFVKIAPSLGYKASMFNLVFANNVASVELWRSLGFKEIGRVPKAGRLKGSDELVDAIMFYYDFESL
ncbi:acyl-CoA N-acyltransferase [Polychytrium aggregatum]|uniref:acyl-CoA N-acyltransferase n=1 Tax=Polychytrium aggregatum TaxID=110093 RepID=UPI0022FE3ADC|nr:acyl-CoA N-acyltransferase [Polychytrium aggregatum]KAI9203161.1 acyl-CoA N-acyltransferase [Polychytrium aggregatum]